MNVTHAHGQAGYAYLRLGDYPRARHHLTAAVAQRGPAAREWTLQTALLTIAQT